MFILTLYLFIITDIGNSYERPCLSGQWDQHGWFGKYFEKFNLILFVISETKGD